MFFKKKAPSSTPKAREDQRGAYRKPNSKSQSLEATLRAPNWDPVRVELVDLSMRGACIRVKFVQDRNLKDDDFVELTIGGMMRSEVRTAARVVNVKRDGQSHIRYGLQFLNINKLYAQLDSFYARHFNRRKHVRVAPPLDRKVTATVRWGGEDLKGHVFDISESGVGLALSKDSSARLAEAKGFEIAFKLPGVEGELSGPVEVRHRTSLNGQSLLGLSFDLEAPGGFARFREELGRFIERRSAEIALWEQSWS